MKRTLGLLIFLVMAIAPMFAQQQLGNEEPASKEDIEKLFTTMHIREQMSSMTKLVAKQSRQMAQDTLKKKLPDASQKDLDHLDAMMDRILQSLDIDGMLDDMIPIYQRHLTKADVAAMVSFYQTPTGQKILREQPEMTAEAMKAVQPRMEKVMNRVLDEAEKMAKEGATEPKPANADKN